MADIPEYLLERSRERRAQLTGQDPGASAAPADAPAAAASDTPATTDSAGAGAAPAAAPEILAPTPAPAPPAPPPPPILPWVAAGKARSRIPIWVMPVLLFLPLWGFMYAGTLESPTRGETGLIGEGSEVYAETAACSSCHGAAGEGTTSGPKLDHGDLLLTFPDDPDGLGLAQHVVWIAQGTNGTGLGRPYGAEERGRVAGWFGEMASFADSLTAEELLAVTLYERAVHGENATARTLADVVEHMLASGELHLPEAFSPDVTVEEVQNMLAPAFDYHPPEGEGTDDDPHAGHNHE